MGDDGGVLKPFCNDTSFVGVLGVSTTFIPSLRLVIGLVFITPAGTGNTLVSCCPGCVGVFGSLTRGFCSLVLSWSKLVDLVESLRDGFLATGGFFVTWSFGEPTFCWSSGDKGLRLRSRKDNGLLLTSAGDTDLGLTWFRNGFLSGCSLGDFTGDGGTISGAWFSCNGDFDDDDSVLVGDLVSGSSEELKPL